VKLSHLVQTELVGTAEPKRKDKMVDEDKLNQFIGKMLGDLGRSVQRADGTNGRQARSLQGAKADKDDRTLAEPIEASIV
jgi:hypothetical protein